jgi:hypothetical protein
VVAQVLLERCIHASSTTNLGLSYPDLNKAVEDPLSTHHSDESLETVLDAPLSVESAMHLHVPLSLLDHELDLSRHAALQLTLAERAVCVYFCLRLFTHVVRAFRAVCCLMHAGEDVIAWLASVQGNWSFCDPK